MPYTAYIKLKPSAGGGMLTVTNVSTHNIVSFNDYAGETYRDLFPLTFGELKPMPVYNTDPANQWSTTPLGDLFPTVPVLGKSDPVLKAGAASQAEAGKFEFKAPLVSVVPDNMSHEPMRQANIKRMLHEFLDSNDVVIARIWDDFVVGVTNSNEQS